MSVFRGRGAVIGRRWAVGSWQQQHEGNAGNRDEIYFGAAWERAVEPVFVAEAFDSCA
ncbi:hypothetical protein [Microcoleus sp.]|uniref:hypothetical protein n=1 Tax=Microcoleus sp. TaxID=44472 RepID=UPI00403EA146